MAILKREFGIAIFLYTGVDCFLGEMGETFEIKLPEILWKQMILCLKYGTITRKIITMLA